MNVLRHFQELMSVGTVISLGLRLEVTGFKEQNVSIS